MSFPRKIDSTYIGCHFFTALSRLVYSERKNEPCEIVVVLSGVYQARYKDGQREVSLSAQSGEAVLWPAKIWRMEFNDPKRPLHCIAIYFRNPSLGDFPRWVRDTAGLIRVLAQRLIEIKTRHLEDDLAQELFKAYTDAILAEFIRRASPQKEHLTEQVNQFVEANMSRAFTLSELALAMNLEPHYFGRRFKQLTGCTPMDYVRRSKAVHASEVILMSPDRPLKALCASVGIANPKRLVRLINRYTATRVRDLRRPGS
jgi:AraC-like DNA-binding protein